MSKIEIKIEKKMKTRTEKANKTDKPLTMLTKGEGPK